MPAAAFLDLVAGHRSPKRIHAEIDSTHAGNVEPGSTAPSTYQDRDSNALAQGEIDAAPDLDIDDFAAVALGRGEHATDRYRGKRFPCDTARVSDHED